MSWPQWSGSVTQPGIMAAPPLPGVVNTAQSILNPTGGVLNPAPAVLPPGVQYTPEQWAQMQQQNWQQWAQWQQQYQQWHQQYGAEFQKSMSALTANAVTATPGQPPLPAAYASTTAIPPLPAETKPPLPPEDPPIPQPQTPSLTQNQFNMFSTPPPSHAVGYNTTSMSVPPPKFNQPSSTNHTPDKQQNKPNQNWQNYNNSRSNQNYANNQYNQPPPYRNQQNPEQQPQQQNKRPLNQSNEYFNSKRNRYDQNVDNSSWQAPQQQKPSTLPIAGAGNLPPKPNPEELSEAEKKFDKEFAAWEAQFNKWKEQNAGHPDKEQYKEYEKKWEEWRAKLLERREQMRRKRLSLATSSPLKTTPVTPEQSSHKSPQTSGNAQQRPPLLGNAPLNFVKPPPNLNNEPLKFKDLETSEPAVNQDSIHSDKQLEQKDDEKLEPESSFLNSTNTTTAGGIPGLDLVKDDGKTDLSDVEKNEEEKRALDIDAISKNINSILGDTKLLNMLSQVSQNQNLNTSTNVDTTSKIANEEKSLLNESSFNQSANSCQSYGDQSNQGDNYYGVASHHESINNFDDQTRSSFTVGLGERDQKFDNRADGFEKQNQIAVDETASFPNRFGDNAMQGKFDKFGKPNPDLPFTGQFGNEGSFKGAGPNNFDKGEGYSRGPGGFSSNDNNFGRNYGNSNRGGPDNFGRGSDRSENYGSGSGNFNSGMENFGKFNNDKFNRGPNSFNRDSNTFNRGPDNFNRGADNFNRGPGNINRGPDNFNRGPDDCGSENFDRGTDNFRRGPDNFNQGPNNFSGGAVNFNRGPVNFNRDPDNFKRGPDNFNRGPDNFNRGPDNFNRGQDNYNRGPDNFNKGPDKFNQGPDNFNRGPPDAGNLNRGPINNFNRAPDNFNKGPDNFNRGLDNFSKGPDFNRGPPNFTRAASNFNKGPNDFNKGPDNYNRGSDNINRGLDNFNRGFGPNNFNRGPDSFNKASNNSNRGPGNFIRDQNDFNRGNFDKDHGDFDQRFDNFDRGLDNADETEEGFDAAEDYFCENQDTEVVGQTDMSVSFKEHDANKSEGNVNSDTNVSFGFEPQVGNNFGDEQNTRFSNDVPVDNVPSDSLDPNNPVNSKNADEDMLKPSVVVEYDHKSLKPPESEVSIEPVQTFDYRHKPLNRIPLPQRPKWLNDAVKNFREFEPLVTRTFEQLRQYPLKERYDFDERKPYGRQFDEKRKPFNDKWQYDERRHYDRNFDSPTSENNHGKGFEPHRKYDKGFEQSRKNDYERGFEQSRKDDYGKGFESSRKDDYGRGFESPRNYETGFESQRNDYEDSFELPEHDCDDRIGPFNSKGEFEKESDKFPQQNKNITLIEDLLNPPERFKRPPRIVIILRGPPGSGKTHLAKLIKDKEVENGGSAPRILSLDDYFMVEQEKEVVEDGKQVKIKDMVFEYEECMEPTYRASLLKSFRKTVTDGLFSFIIVDNVNDKVKYFGEMWSFAKQNGFQVYVCQMELDVQTCSKRNIHDRSEEDIEKCVSGWEPTPSHHPVLDATSLIQSASIPDVEMEEINSPSSDDNDGKMEDQAYRSKWDNFDCSIHNLAKLDGINKPLRPSRTMEDYLQLEEWTPTVPTKPGQKRVRWADLEERKEQEKMRAIGFVVGQTDWNRMMDPTMGSSALTQTKYIERVRKY